MHKKPTEEQLKLKVPDTERTLNYEAPEINKNYWVVDDFFNKKSALAISNRCFMKKKWKLGKPYTSELWPGMRSEKALRPQELKQVEDTVKNLVGVSKLWVAESNDVVVDTNTAILVAGSEGSARPHVDNRSLCRYAAVLYLNVNPDPDGGTSFYRLKHSNDAPGGNIVEAPYKNLVDSLQTRALPIDGWYLDKSIENCFNRLIIFKGNIVHSASKYFGENKRDKRLAITFFWLAED